MLLDNKESAILLLMSILCLCDGQKPIKQYAQPPVPAIPWHQTPSHPSAHVGSSSPAKAARRNTDSYLPPVMQALAYYIEMLQYEPLFTTTIEPPFSADTVTPAASKPTFDSPVGSNTPPPKPTFSQPTPTTTATFKPTLLWSTTTWKPFSTPPTQKPVTWWSPSSTSSTTYKPSWWSTTSPRPTASWPKPTASPGGSWVQWTNPTTTKRPTESSDDEEDHHSSTTPSWWNPPSPTPSHKPGNIPPEKVPLVYPNQQYTPTKPSKPLTTFHSIPQNMHGPHFGDLALLSLSNQPYFNYYVPMQHWPNRAFVKKPEYQYLHQLPAELLQDIENEAYEAPELPDQAIIDNFRRVYDDFHTRIRGVASLTGKKKIPETRPYVLFLMIYDLCKREAKRLALQEVEGYTPELLKEIHELSTYSAARQLHTLFKRLLDQKSIVARDFLTRADEIMIDLINPQSSTAKALRYIQPLTFEL